jgi:glycosyltransferase involved in cell wall biosynthesis
MSETLPLISVITPSFNQAEFLASTIESVISQGYPNLEYIVIDGGSNDGSLDILKRYSRYLHYWVSEPDLGQADAINKGLRICKGQIFNWINSDDVLEPGALRHIGNVARGLDVIAGGCLNFSSQGLQVTKQTCKLSAPSLIREDARSVFQQPAIWFSRERAIQLGGLDPRLHFVFDWYFAIRYLCRFPQVAYTGRTLARFRLHDASKTVSQSVQFRNETSVALELLLKDPALELEQPAIRERLRYHRWLSQLTDIEISRKQVWEKLGNIMWASLDRPRDAFRRETVGSIRRVLRASSASR